VCEACSLVIPNRYNVATLVAAKVVPDGNRQGKPWRQSGCRSRGHRAVALVAYVAIVMTSVRRAWLVIWFRASETAMQANDRRETVVAAEKAHWFLRLTSRHPVGTRRVANRRNSMKSLAKKMQRFLTSEDGPTAVEYAVMLALIIIVCLTAINSVGTNAKTTFTNVANSIGS
jgi:pilus assembly protein Flp/PilA